MRIYTILAVSFGLIVRVSYGQCFTSPGNPIGGTANMGTLPKEVYRVSFFHKYNYADTYLSGDQKADNVYDHALYNYIGNITSFGITDKFNIDLESGYFINKTIQYRQDDANPMLAGKEITGSGFSNCVLLAKYNVYDNEDKRLEWTIGAGGQIPLRMTPVEKNGTALPNDVQPSTNSFGYVIQSYIIKENSFKGLRFFLYNRYETNFKNIENYKYGNSIVNAVYISKHLWFPWTKGDGLWTAILQIRNEIRTKTIYPSGLYKKASGGYMFYVGPQINMTLAKKWNISVYADIPVYQYMNGIQLSNKYSILFTIAKDIIYNKDIKSELDQME